MSCGTKQLACTKASSALTRYTADRIGKLISSVLSRKRTSRLCPPSLYKTFRDLMRFSCAQYAGCATSPQTSHSTWKAPLNQYQAQIVTPKV